MQICNLESDTVMEKLSNVAVFTAIAVKSLQYYCGDGKKMTVMEMEKNTVITVTAVMPR